MKINIRKSLCVIGVVSSMLMLTGCFSTKNVPYFKNIDTTSLEASRGYHDARIALKDEITVNVTTSDPTVSQQFNKLVYNTLTGGRTVNYSSGSMLPYTVENDGTINFPIVGRVKVVGLTKRQCEEKIASCIKPYLANEENPVVVVSLSSYHVTVLGEVNSPGIKNVATEKYSILEALGAAGDLSIYGKRDNILLLREDSLGEKHTYRLNLNDANIINSPYYYLQQNDVVYVEPNSTKAKNSDIGQSTTLVFSATSILISLTSLLYNILNK